MDLTRGKFSRENSIPARMEYYTAQGGDTFVRNFYHLAIYVRSAVDDLPYWSSQSWKYISSYLCYRRNWIYSQPPIKNLTQKCLGEWNTGPLHNSWNKFRISNFTLGQASLEPLLPNGIQKLGSLALSSLRCCISFADVSFTDLSHRPNLGTILGLLLRYFPCGGY